MNRYINTILFAGILMSTSSALFPASSVLAKDAPSIGKNAVELINFKMDDFHDAADKGDKARYLNHFSEDSVFMGTDDWERWEFKEFSKYVDQRFKDGEGWSYQSIKRYINFSQQQDLAWVDEIVESKKWGRFRGTAVLVKAEQTWKIKHYSLTMLVPNEAWPQISEISKKGYQDRTVEAGVEPVSIE